MRDLDIARRHIELNVRVYRLECSTCGRVEVPITLARPYARCTKRLEKHLFVLTKDATVKAVSRRMKIDWETVKDAEVRYIRGLLRKRELDGITRIGIDEVSYKKGHKYLTLVTDIDGHRVIYATHGNDGATIRRFLRWFGPKHCGRIKVAVTDMHDPYTSALKKGCQRPHWSMTTSTSARSYTTHLTKSVDEYNANYRQPAVESSRASATSCSAPVRTSMASNKCRSRKSSP
jgi:transposase